MASQSTEHCFATPHPEREIRGACPSRTGPSEGMKYRQDSCGSLPSTTRYRSIVDITDRFQSHISGIIFDLSRFCERLSEMLADSATLLAATGFAVGAAAWSGYTPAIAFSLLVLILLALPRSRTDAFALMFCYYAGATWQIIPGASVFFGHHANPIQIVLLWLGTSSILAAPWAALWCHHAGLRLYRAPLTLVLLAVPPLGIIGCASPLTAAGILFPGLAWVGLLLTLLICGFLTAYPRRAIVLTLAFALPAQILYRAPQSPARLASCEHPFRRCGPR